MSTDGPERRSYFLDFRDLIYVVRQQLRLILIFATLTSFLGVAGLLSLAPKYKATAQVLLETRSAKISDIEAVLPGLSTDKAAIDSQIEIITSRPIFDRAINLIRAASEVDTPESSNPEFTRIRLSAVDLNQIDEALASPRAASAFRSNLEVRRKGLSYVVDVIFTYPSPDIAAVMANAIVTAYVEAQREEKILAARWASQQLQGQVLKVRQELHEVLTELEEFKSKHGLVKVGDFELSERMLTEQIQKLIDARARTIQAQALVQQITDSAGDSKDLMAFSAALQSGTILEFRKQYAEVQRRLGEAVSRFGENHISVKNARAELSNLKSEIDLEINRLAKSARTELKMAQEQAVRLSEEIRSLQRQHASLNKHRIALSEIERRATAKQKLYLSLFNRLLETEVQVDLQSDDATITQLAEKPIDPSFPNPLAFPLVIVAGAVVGGAAGLLREITNVTFRTSRDVTYLTGLQPIAQVPKVSQFHPAASRWISRRRARGEDLDHAHFDAGSRFTRSLVKIASWLGANGQQGAAEVWLIASTNESDGKSTIAENLAKFVGAQKTKVLLVDLSRNLPPASEANREANVAEGKSGQGQEESKNIWNAYSETCGNFDRIRLGKDTIASGEIARRLTDFRERYDTIILVSPPVNLFAPAVKLLENCDKVIFVVRAGLTNSNKYWENFGQFVQLYARPLGFVLNMKGREKLEKRSEPVNGSIRTTTLRQRLSANETQENEAA